MDYFLKICVLVLTIGSNIDKIDGASKDRTCYYCRETNRGRCNDMNDIDTVRCDTLPYSRMSVFNDSNTEGFRNDDNGEDYGQIEPRTNGRPPPHGSKFQCVKERRRYLSGEKKNFMLRTCVLNQFADTYCQDIKDNGLSNIYHKYDLTECHICDSDNCNFGNSMKIPFGLVIIASISTILKSISI